MKKVLFTSILLLSVVSFGGGNAYAQVTSGNDTDVTTTSSASVTFTASEDSKTLTISGQGDLTEYTNDGKKVSEMVKEEISNGNFETVKFENTGTSPLLIDAGIVRSILFGTSEWNSTSIKVLDLGEATINNLTSEAFRGQSNEYTHSSNLETLTLPLTQKTEVTEVTIEGAETKVKRMVVPSNIIPAGYNNDKARLTTVIIPKGYEQLGKDAFKDLTMIKTFRLPETLTVIGESAFKGCRELASIELNERLVNIGKEAFNGTSLTSINFPSSLRIINDAAFLNCRIFDMKFNAGLLYIGNSAFALSGNNTNESTLEIPASVRYIGPFAFAVHYYQDVFFYGEKAPIMPVGKSSYINDTQAQAAFSANTYMGNNGFNEGKQWKEGEIYDNAYIQGYANRENYKNGGVYFTMFHYPKGLTDEQRAEYTDITRVYKTAEGNQKFCYAKTPSNLDTYVEVGKESVELKYDNLDAPKDCDFGFQDTYLGHQYVWPSQEQWRRSYVVNALGYNWDGVTQYRSTLSDEDIAILAYAGFKEGTGEGEYSRDELEKIAHLGTRMFVLGNADVTKDEDLEEEPEYPIPGIKGGEWWTICLPFNMTKAMVRETFGEDTQVCLFDRVVRQVNRNTKKNRIVLYFTQNVYKHKTEPKNADGTWDFKDTAPAPEDDDIVIYAHESYMIHPTITDKDAVFAVKNYQPIVGSPTPTVVIGRNQYVGESDIPDNVPYRYVGNYLAKVDAQEANQSGIATQALQDVLIPKFSYVYASDGKETKFWFLQDEYMTWQPNKCVVQTNTRGDGELDNDEFFDYNASGAKQASFFGEDFSDSTTSIDNEMVIIAGEGSDAPVYNIDGTLVNTTGDLTGLPKGVYIKGGKKFVVK